MFDLLSLEAVDLAGGGGWSVPIPYCLGCGCLYDDVIRGLINGAIYNTVTILLLL